MGSFRNMDYNKNMNEFEEVGVTVFPGLVQGIDAHEKRFWKWLSRFGTGIKPDDPSTWTTGNWVPSLHGIIQHFGIGQAYFMWKLRGDQNLRHVFELIYRTPDLVVSFDGANASRPSKRTTKNWGHIDQSGMKIGFECAQSTVTIRSSNAQFVVLENSHKYHQDFFSAFPQELKRKDWHKLTPEQYQWFLDQGCTERAIVTQAGDVTVWDSRTVHWVRAPTDTVRLAAYISYEPRLRVTKKSRSKRVQAFSDKRTTSHWSSNPKLNGKHFQHYGHPELLEKFPDQPCVLSDLDESEDPELLKILNTLL